MQRPGQDNREFVALIERKAFKAVWQCLRRRRDFRPLDLQKHDARLAQPISQFSAQQIVDTEAEGCDSVSGLGPYSYRPV